jgi:NAD(P)-dependent dehydrogenase (short-subunit alcohol dehydrogenase family)
MDLNLSGQVAVVVGGASGIGLAIAKEFAREGCRVGIIDKSRETERAAARSPRPATQPASDWWPT